MRRLWKIALSVLHPDQCKTCSGWPPNHIGNCPKR